MPKSCTKRKLRKLQQAERNSDRNTIEVYPKGQKTSKSYKQRVCDFFKRITTRSNASDPTTCSSNNNNNTEKHVTQDRGDPGVITQDRGDPGLITFLDDIHVTTQSITDRITRKEQGAEEDVYDAYQNLNKQRRPQQDVTAPLLSSYAKGHTYLASALIEMLNNEPSLQEVPIYRNKIRNSDDQRETCDNDSPVHDSTVTYVVGETVFTGRFNLKVLDIIGEGSQATIFEVSRDTIKYAAKISKDPAFTKYLHHEYELLSTLSHDNIVSLHDQVPDGFLMGILPDQLINHIKQNFDTTTMKLPLRDPITIGLLNAVKYLHSKDIAHLDIKPDNILLTADGVPKLADFGLALRTRNEDGQLKSLKGIRGSIPFLCPEVLTRRKDNIMTAIDVWAVGVVMYTILTGGQLPFGSISAKNVYQQQIEGPPRLPHRVRSVIINDASASNYFCVIFQLLNLQPERRPSIDSALRMISPLT